MYVYIFACQSSLLIGLLEKCPLLENSIRTYGSKADGWTEIDNFIENSNVENAT